MVAADPSALSVLITLAAGALFAAALDHAGAFSRGLAALARVPGALLAGLAALIATLLVLFTRFFSDLGAVAGLGDTVAAWGRLLAEGPGGTPPQFFLLAVLLYEPLALALGLLAAVRGRINRAGGLGWPLLGGWFAAALVLWSLSAGGQPQHAIHVALPLVLLGGGVVGDLVAALDRRDTLRGRGGALLLTLLLLLVALGAFAVLASRIDEAAARHDRLLDQIRTPAVLETLIVGVAVVVPLAFVAVNLLLAERAVGRGRQPVLLLLLALAVPLATFTLRSSAV